MDDMPWIRVRAIDFVDNEGEFVTIPIEEARDLWALKKGNEGPAENIS